MSIFMNVFRCECLPVPSTYARSARVPTKRVRLSAADEMTGARTKRPSLRRAATVQFNHDKLHQPSNAFNNRR